MDRELYVQLAERHPSPVVVCRCEAASVALVWSRGLDARTILSEPGFATRWRIACERALDAQGAVEVELPCSRHFVRRATVIALDALHVAVHVHPPAQPVRENERRFELLFSQNTHAVFFTRLDRPFHWPTAVDAQDVLLARAYDELRVTAANDVMCRQMGFPAEALVGTVPRARWNGEYVAWREHMRRLFDQGHTYHSVRAPRADGTWIDLEGEYVCTYDDDGRISGHYGIQHDITQTREAVATATTTRERLELVVLGADLVVWEIDVPNRRVIYEPSPSWSARLGYEARAFSVAEWTALIHPDDLRETLVAFREHLAGKTPHFRAEYRVRTAKGDSIWILCTGKLASASRVVGIAVDTTERKALRARVVASERLASLGTLAAGVGHEINNPLTYVGLNLELLERKLEDLDLDPETAKILAAHVDGALYGTRRVGAIVKDLQMLARPRDQGTMLVNPATILERCLRITEHQIRHRAQLVLDLGPVPDVRSSEDRLVQVCLNLLVNAIHAIPEGAAEQHWIRVATSHAAEHVIIEVSENGVGIPPAVLDHIFEPFFTTKEVGHGTGLGLSICRSIVTELGGEIDVTSERDRGTAFRVSLPVAAPTAAPELPKRVHVGNVRRILVIDDEPALGHLLESLLGEITVACESTASGALARIQRGESFDRILCDVMMPEVTGVDFYEQLAEHLRPSVVFVTGGSFTERARAFLERVPNRTLLKPFDIADLERVLVG